MVRFLICGICLLARARKLPFCPPQREKGLGDEGLF
jgi:hypothetical protein